MCWRAHAEKKTMLSTTEIAPGRREIKLLNETIYADINVPVADPHKRDDRWRRVRTSFITMTCTACNESVHHGFQTHDMFTERTEPG